MADSLSSIGRVIRSEFTQICVARGIVSWGSEDNDATGELQLWYHERNNNYCIYARQTAGGDIPVCKLIDVLKTTTTTTTLLN